MRRNSRRHTALSSLRVFNAAILMMFLIPAGFVAGVLTCVNRVMPSRLSLANYQPRLTTEIFSTEMHADGTETHTLLARVFQEGEDREPAALSEIPLPLRQATIAIEDRRFYQHFGISPPDIVRAAWVNMHAGRIVQGASTITQQVVRNVWLTQAKTYDRKLKEIVLALALERTYSKDEILEMYLNEVYYGHGAYGVRVASKMFFGKEPRDLKLDECALLAGLPQRPADQSPYVSPKAAKNRRHEVLIAMVHEGYVTSDQAQQADAEQIQAKLKPLRPRGVSVERAPYFTHAVIRQLCAQYGVDAVYQGGLRVYTTLDMRVQEAAEQELTRAVERMRDNGETRRGLVGQGALACVQVNTGAVLAMVGGVGPYNKVQYNRAYPGGPNYGRQPGSSFKPYVWATALESGYGPYSRFSGSPITIGNWSPKNAEGGEQGRMTLTDALAHSVNLVSVRVVQAVGGTSVIKYASQMMDIPPSRLHDYPSLALGVFEISPLEQASGYAVFANGGVRCKRQFVRRMEDYQGNLLLVVEPERERVLRADTARNMVKMMRGVVTYGTGTRAAISGNDKVCGKTGTTNDKRDAWFVGYTPDLACAVWIGNDNFTPMPDGFGGHLAAPVFRSFMSRALDILGCSNHADYPSAEQASSASSSDAPKRKSRTVRICVDSGGRANSACPHTELRTFGPDERIPPPCRIHGRPSQPAPTGNSNANATKPETGSGGGNSGSDERVTISVCTESGGLATSHCPQVAERTVRRSEMPGPCTIHSGSSHRDGGGQPPPNETN